jgi:hypothetical protein
MLATTTTTTTTASHETIKDDRKLQSFFDTNEFGQEVLQHALGLHRKIDDDCNRREENGFMVRI